MLEPVFIAVHVGAGKKRKKEKEAFSRVKRTPESLDS
jgi:hypothetical protein